MSSELKRCPVCGQCISNIMHENLGRTHAIQGALISTLIDAMEEVRTLIEGYIDVKDGPSGECLQCLPNDAMRADQLLEVVIAKARRARGAK